MENWINEGHFLLRFALMPQPFLARVPLFSRIMDPVRNTAQQVGLYEKHLNES